MLNQLSLLLLPLGALVLITLRLEHNATKKVHTQKTQRNVALQTFPINKQIIKSIKYYTDISISWWSNLSNNS